MSTLIDCPSFASTKVDFVNFVVRGVSVVTLGDARGHDLEVDKTTLEQMLRCAKAKIQVPVKVDHKSGAGGVCGYLTNFQIDGNKMKADWYLLEAHPEAQQIMETASRMPRGVGLSVAFVSQDKGEYGKARCQELISVDYVVLPAANPDGLFSAKFPERPRLNAYRFKHDRNHDLAARVSRILFHERAALTRLVDSVGDNITIPVPFSDQAAQAQAAYNYSKKPLVRRVAKKVAKVAIGAGLGHWAGRHYGSRAGTLTGAVAGLLFSNASVRGNIRLSLNYSKRISHL